MTKERFRQLVKRLHPDASGTNRTRMHYEAVVRAKERADARANYCGCGVAIDPNAKQCMPCYRRRRYGAPKLLPA